MQIVKTFFVILLKNFSISILYFSTATHILYFSTKILCQTTKNTAQPTLSGVLYEPSLTAGLHRPVNPALALLLLMLGVLADDHHATLALDDLALLTDGLHRGTYLHDGFLLFR